MLAVELPLLGSDGQVEVLSQGDERGRLGIQPVAEQLHTAARRLRVFLSEPVALDERMILRLVERTAEQLEAGP
jgi:hypothetical protein